MLATNVFDNKKGKKFDTNSLIKYLQDYSRNVQFTDHKMRANCQNRTRFINLIINNNLTAE